MDPTLLTGKWRVISFSVRYNTTHTPEGWAEFTFAADGTVRQKVTRQEAQSTHHGNLYWRLHDKMIVLYQQESPVWYVKHLSANDMVLNQGDSSQLSYTLIKIA